MLSGSRRHYRRIGAKEREIIPEHKKKNELPMAAMRSGMTVFIAADAT
jgi:hypothetical protein